MSAGVILVLGDLMRDIVVRLGGPIRRGTDQRAAVTTMPGGSAANLAAWLAHTSAPVRLLATVGAADLASERARLAQLGVEAALVGHPTRPTGSLVALIDADGERSFLTDRGANDMLAVADLPPGLLDGVVHLHLSGYALVGTATRATAHHLTGQARARGIPVSFDPGSAGFIMEVGPAVMMAGGAGATLCVANAAEAAALTGTADPADQLACLSRHHELVVLKRGASGASARHRDGRTWTLPAPVVAVVDTIGAGDAFLAAYLIAHRAGHAVPDCLAQAVAQGSFATTLAGGLPPPRT